METPDWGNAPEWAKFTAMDISDKVNKLLLWCQPICTSCEKHFANMPHSCPMQEELYDDDSVCDCCDNCTGECRDSI